MRFLLATFLLFLTYQYSAKAQCAERYKQRYFNSIQVFQNVVYTQDAPTLLAASLTTETTYNKDLVMDIFMPPTTDTVTDRPVVVLGHGGGFINVAFMGGTLLVGTKDNDDVQALADTLAHWGYVVAVIEYRLGFNVGSTSSIKRAVWRGAQDMSAAIRFFRKNATWFGIDPNRVFSGGSSAGAFCAIHSTFVDYNERMAESYELIPILKKDLGAMHSRPVVELTSFNPFVGTSVLGDDVDSIPVGIAAYWGAIADLGWMPQGNSAPMIMFHGTSDLVVSNKCEKPFSSVILVAPVTCGSYMMDSTLAANGMPHEVHYGPGENHEYWGVLNGNWLPSGPNAYWPDIIQKTADFFYDIMEPATPIVSGPDSVLPMVNYTYSIANPLLNHSYCWEVTGGTIVSPNVHGTSIDVQFYSSSTQGTVGAQAIDLADVASEQGVKNSTVSNNVAVHRLDEAALGVQIQPNPAQVSCEVLIHSKNNVDATISICNYLGQVVVEQKISLQVGSNSASISVQDLPKGSYFVQVLTGKGRAVKRLVLN